MAGLLDINSFLPGSGRSLTKPPKGTKPAAPGTGGAGQNFGNPFTNAITNTTPQANQTGSFLPGSGPILTKPPKGTKPDAPGTSGAGQTFTGKAFTNNGQQGPVANTAPQRPTTNQSAIPPGVNPRDWANPGWRSIWMRQHPDWKPPAAAPAPLIPSPRGGTPPATSPVAPINPNTPQPNPNPATPEQPTAQPVAPANQSAIPPGVNPRDWANPTWRSIWMRQHPDWKPPAAAPVAAQPTTTPAAPAAPQPAAPAAPAKTYKGAMEYFDPKKGTVAGQMEGLLDPSSPLMLKAQTQALQGMNSRGLQNSSMAIGAGQSAMIDAALPIASQDAQTYQALSMLDADYDFKNDFLTKQNHFDQIALNANLSSQEKQQMTATLGSLFNSVIQQVGSIMKDEELDATAMKAAIDQIYQGYEDTVTTYADLLGYNISWGD